MGLPQSLKFYAVLLLLYYKQIVTPLFRCLVLALVLQVTATYISVFCEV
jgi:hypothetical protein